MTEKHFLRHDIEWTPEKISRLWDFYSSTAAFDDVYFGYRAGRLFAKLLKRRRLLTKAKNILDMSCGKGDIILACSRHLKTGQKISGIDVSEQSIKETLKLNQHNPHFTGATHFSEASQILTANSQDLVFSTEVIEHLTDGEVTYFLKECRRLLCKKGTLVLTTPNSEILDSGKCMCPECGCTFHRWQHRQSWSAQRLTERVTAAGFQVIECKPIVWESWPVNVYFSLSGRKKPGLYLIAESQEHLTDA